MVRADYLQHRQIPGEVGRPTGDFTLDLCTSTYLHRDWTSSWRHHDNIKGVINRKPGSARDELILMHETIGYLSANLFELSLRMNELGGSNQVVYTAYCLGLWTYRWWHLVQHKGNLIIKKHMPAGDVNWEDEVIASTFGVAIEKEAQRFLKERLVPYLTTLRYEDIDGEVKLKFSRDRPVQHQVSARQLFEPGYDVYQNEQVALIDSTGDDERQFNKHLQICSICIRKEVLYLSSSIMTMYLVRHRPAFQSLRVTLRETYTAFPLDGNAHVNHKTDLDINRISISSLVPVKVDPTPEVPAKVILGLARNITEHYANCLERIATINESSLERAKQAQDGTQKLFQTEGVITGLLLSTAAGGIGRVGGIDRRVIHEHGTLIGITFGLFACGALLSLWASILYLTSAVRLAHPFSRPYIKHRCAYQWIFVFFIHWYTLTRFILATALMAVLAAFLAYTRVYFITDIDSVLNPPTELTGGPYVVSEVTANCIKVAPTIIAALAISHVGARAIWHYVWEYAYGWRVWRRYKAAIEGNDTLEENQYRHHHVFIEALYFFYKDTMCKFFLCHRREGQVGLDTGRDMEALR